MIKNKLKLILASGSPRRKELLAHLQIPFEVCFESIEETSLHEDPVNFSRDISEQKGNIVFSKRSDHCFVISADTVVCYQNKIFGKPKDEAEARDFLLQLSGHTHQVYTAVALHLRWQDLILKKTFVEVSSVTFNTISPELLNRYLKTKDSLDKAGAYGIQGPSLTFISKIEGDYANVVGFPLSRFVQESEIFLKPIIGDQTWLDLF